MSVNLSLAVHVDVWSAWSEGGYYQGGMGLLSQDSIPLQLRTLDLLDPSVKSRLTDETGPCCWPGAAHRCPHHGNALTQR